MGKLIGTDPNQVPTNANLGTMSFQDYDVAAPMLIGGRRNIFINGGFNVAQRGTSFTQSSGGYMLDRWTSYIGEGTWTVSQDTDVPPGGYSKSMKWLVSTADSTPTTATHVSTRVEGQDLQCAGWGTTEAKPLILSFWVKSNVATRHNVEMDLYHPDNSFEAAIPHYQIDKVDTWEFKTIIIPPTSLGIRNTNETGLYINIFISCGGQFHAPGQNPDPSDYAGFWAPANTFSNGERGFGVSGIVKNQNSYIKWTGMQLEVDYSGTGKPTPFEHRSYGEEFAACQRYYQRFDADGQDFTNIGIAIATNSAWYVPIILPGGRMRADPALSYSAVGDFRITLQHSNSSAVTSMMIGYGNPLHPNLSVQSGSNSASNGARMFGYASSTTAWLAFDAEW